MRDKKNDVRKVHSHSVWGINHIFVEFLRFVRRQYRENDEPSRFRCLVSSIWFFARCQRCLALLHDRFYKFWLTIIIDQEANLRKYMIFTMKSLSVCQLRTRRFLSENSFPRYAHSFEFRYYQLLHKYHRLFMKYLIFYSTCMHE